MIRDRVEYDERMCLSVDVFEGDRGTTEDRILRDKIVTARKVRPCFLCGEDITAGSRVRTLVARFEGRMCSFTWCECCCWAMVESWRDEGKAWEARCTLRGL